MVRNSAKARERAIEREERKRRRKINDTLEDKVFYTVIGIILTLLLLAVGVPILYVLAASFSSPQAVVAGRVFLWPVDFSLEGYKAVFENGQIVTGFRNSIIYVVLGTSINLFMTLICAYPLSRRNFPGGGPIMMLFTFTMFFNGGMIPGYILMTQLHLLNTIWVMVIPGAISVNNMIIARTFLRSNIPNELLEAAQIDGCNDFGFFVKIVLPLSKSVIAVLTLYYAITHWNSYFNALIYLTRKELYPLQIVLRDILISNQVDAEMVYDQDLADAKEGLAELLKYSLIVVSVVPVLIIYPFVQKHFVKGVMIGSIKG